MYVLLNKLPMKIVMFLWNMTLLIKPAVVTLFGTAPMVARFYCMPTMYHQKLNLHITKQWGSIRFGLCNRLVRDMKFGTSVLQDVHDGWNEWTIVGIVLHTQKSPSCRRSGCSSNGLGKFLLIASSSFTQFHQEHQSYFLFTKVHVIQRTKEMIFHMLSPEVEHR